MPEPKTPLMDDKPNEGTQGRISVETKFLNSLKDWNAKPQRRPYLCPVCQGHGSVPAGFYGLPGCTSTASTTPDTCRACDGTGVLWG